MASTKALNIDERRAEDAIAIPAAPKLKKCKGPCQIIVEMEQVADHFDVDAKNKDGFKKICRSCRRQLRLQKETNEAAAQLEHITSAVLKRVSNARPGGPNVPHSADLLERIYTLCGGVNGVAALLMKCFLEATPGSPTQQKILCQIIGLTIQNTEVGGAKKPIEMLSDEEVDAEMERLMRMKSIQAPIENAIRILPDDFEDEDSDLQESSQ